MKLSTANDLIMLIVEDNAADVAFFKEALEASQTIATLYVVEDGCDAMRFLRRQERYSDAPRPDVIVLDLNLPIKDGKELLQEVMAEPELRMIPVAVLTTSTTDMSVCSLCPPGRSLYFTKTVDFDELQNIVRAIAAFAQRLSETG